MTYSKHISRSCFLSPCSFSLCSSVFLCFIQCASGNRVFPIVCNLRKTTAMQARRVLVSTITAMISAQLFDTCTPTSRTLSTIETASRPGITRHH
ncbi:hypothetical protein BJ878DRAFT_489230 [Calycina marina]|uniref:Secreted protein n=1 Tax=Calycina marina TaxID=1763456 RepID=A0A9P7ZA27_9HELO|nr:hypothetical protein BJ878DRAFT_489230 [Calycina marina]